jgi:16S rRNA (guanine527-N7)-methyltransferase
MSLATRLQAGFSQLGLQLDPEPFLAYLGLLQTWNQAYNLTAVREAEQQVGLHILDSLAVLPWLHGQRILDVGSGAGLPGIPLALARPDVQMVLLDSNGKKTRFLQEVKRALGLSQVEVVHARAENYHPTQGFDTVISRACSDLHQLMVWTDHLVQPYGIWLAMKGRTPVEELAAIRGQPQVYSYTVPEVVGERCCVVMSRENSYG